MFMYASSNDDDVNNGKVHNPYHLGRPLLRYKHKRDLSCMCNLNLNLNTKSSTTQAGIVALHSLCM
jgi:hypothetical protein